MGNIKFSILKLQSEFLITRFYFFKAFIRLIINPLLTKNDYENYY
jgi:hypothetical protein